MIRPADYSITINGMDFDNVDLTTDQNYQIYRKLKLDLSGQWIYQSSCNFLDYINNYQ